MQTSQWYEPSFSNAHDQGLVADENTGENIAITYKKADAKLIAAAPELLGLAYAILSYCQDDSRSERRRKAIIDSTKELINKAKRSE